MIQQKALRKHRQVSGQPNQIKVVLLLRKNIMNAENATLKDTIQCIIVLLISHIWTRFSKMETNNTATMQKKN